MDTVLLYLNLLAISVLAIWSYLVNKWRIAEIKKIAEDVRFLMREHGKDASDATVSFGGLITEMVAETNFIKDKVFSKKTKDAWELLPDFITEDSLEDQVKEVQKNYLMLIKYLNLVVVTKEAETKIVKQKK